jgi:hypothetical protein
MECSSVDSSLLRPERQGAPHDAGRDRRESFARAGIRCHRVLTLCMSRPATWRSRRSGTSSDGLELQSCGSPSVDVNMQQSDERFFFVHVMKTGGASLGVQLRRQFGPAVYPDPNIDGDPTWAYSTSAMLLEHWEARRNQVKLISGHFPPCIIELLGDDFTTLTLFREPVERTLSFLRQRSTTDERFVGWPLEQVFDDPGIRRHRLVNNHVVSMFSVTPADMYIGLTSYALDRGSVIREEDIQVPIDCNREDLSRAKERLAAIDVVGLQEHFDDFVAELTRRFGWRLGHSVRHNQTERVPTSKAFRERIAEDNALDIELYDFARTLHEQRLR